MARSTRVFSGDNGFKGVASLGIGELVTTQPETSVVLFPAGPVLLTGPAQDTTSRRAPSSSRNCLRNKPRPTMFLDNMCCSGILISCLLALTNCRYYIYITRG